VWSVLRVITYAERLHKLSKPTAAGLCALGNAIRASRKDRGWSQEKLAERADMLPNYIGKVERGEKNVTFDSILRICAALETPPSALLLQAKL